MNPSSLSDPELLSATVRAAQTERDATARLVALLSEVDARRLYLSEGYSSMFVFCTRRLHMSEHAAYARIEAARVARRIPGILDRLADGRLSLTTVGLLAPHLTAEYNDALLDAAQYQSKREVERLIAALNPQPDIPATIRALPVNMADVMTAPEQTLSVNDEVFEPATTPADAKSVAAAPQTFTADTFHRRAAAAPLSPRRYLLRVTIGEETQRKLERARDLLRHEVTDGDLAAIIDRALTLLVSKAERTKFAATTAKPSSRVAAPEALDRSSSSAGSAGGSDAPATKRSRRIPAAVRRAVWARDQGRCSFAGHDGRCGETGFLEFHHVVPFAAGGPSTIENLELRCRSHNGYEAEQAGLTLWVRQPTRSGPS